MDIPMNTPINLEVLSTLSPIVIRFYLFLSLEKIDFKINEFFSLGTRAQMAEEGLIEGKKGRDILEQDFIELLKDSRTLFTDHLTLIDQTVAKWERQCDVKKDLRIIYKAVVESPPNIEAAREAYNRLSTVNPPLTMAVDKVEIGILNTIVTNTEVSYFLEQFNTAMLIIPRDVKGAARAFEALDALIPRPGLEKGVNWIEMKAKLERAKTLAEDMTLFNDAMTAPRNIPVAKEVVARIRLIHAPCVNMQDDGISLASVEAALERGIVISEGVQLFNSAMSLPKPDLATAKVALCTLSGVLPAVTAEYDGVDMEVLYHAYINATPDKKATIEHTAVREPITLEGMTNTVPEACLAQTGMLPALDIAMQNDQAIAVDEAIAAAAEAAEKAAAKAQQPELVSAQEAPFIAPGTDNPSMGVVVGVLPVNSNPDE
jgi:hypothetical protein